MARILYGVHGTGHGHAIRALAVAQLFPEHEFLFISHGTGLDMLRRAHPVFECPNPETIVVAHRVRLWATLSRLRRFMRQYGQVAQSVRELFGRFRPDAALSDYEHFVPLIAREQGVPCLSLDHQHIVPLCGPLIPWHRYPDYLATVWTLHRFFNHASDYLATSFFPPPRPSTLNVVPPLLRQEVLRREARNGPHVVAYQGYSTSTRFVPFLKTIPGPVFVYGLDRAGQEANLYFKPNSAERFLEDLAACRYVICGGGHSLISESLHFGKPVISYPIRRAIEQFLNAWHVEHLGYGRMLTTLRPSSNFLESFESSLGSYRHRILNRTFCGNDAVRETLRSFFEKIHG